MGAGGGGFGFEGGGGGGGVVVVGKREELDFGGHGVARGEESAVFEGFDGAEDVSGAGGAVGVDEELSCGLGECFEHEDAWEDGEGGEVVGEVFLGHGDGLDRDDAVFGQFDDAIYEFEAHRTRGYRGRVLAVGRVEGLERGVVTDDAGTTAGGSGGAYCRECAYDLSALMPGDGAGVGGELVCPECGTGFDPEDPGTYHRKAGGSLVWFTVFRAVPMAVVVVVVVLAWMLTWVPVPTPLHERSRFDDWRMWVWMDEHYGWGELSGGGQRLDVYLVGDEARAFVAEEAVFDDRGVRVGFREAWRVERDGERWRIEAAAGAAEFGRVLSAWNETRDRRFGLYVDPGTPARDRNAEALSYVGGEAGALAALVAAYEVRLRPGRPRDGEPDFVWYHDVAREEIRRVPAELAHLLTGYDPRDLDDPRHPERRVTRWAERRGARSEGAAGGALRMPEVTFPSKGSALFPYGR